MQEQVTIFTIVKNSSYFVAFVAGVEWLGFNPESILLLGILMFMDIVTAIARVVKTEGGKNVRSAQLRKGITAKFLLSSGVFSIAIASKGVGFDMQHMAQGAITVLMLGELYSILGNIHSAKTGKPKVEFDAMVVLLSKVRNLLDKVEK